MIKNYTVTLNWQRRNLNARQLSTDSWPGATVTGIEQFET